MVVLRPLSWIRGVRGAPTLVRFRLCSRLNALHSGPRSRGISFRTVPQFLQICSPVAVSVIISELPHSHWSFRAILSTFIMFSGSMVIIHLYVVVGYTSCVVRWVNWGGFAVFLIIIYNIL